MFNNVTIHVVYIPFMSMYNTDEIIHVGECL